MGGRVGGVAWCAGRLPPPPAPPRHSLRWREEGSRTSVILRQPFQTCVILWPGIHPPGGVIRLAREGEGMERREAQHLPRFSRRGARLSIDALASRRSTGGDFVPRGRASGGFVRLLLPTSTPVRLSGLSRLHRPEAERASPSDAPRTGLVVARGRGLGASRVRTG
jgi:hypothetical protein